MASTADFKNGLCFKFNNDLYTIIEFQHVKPGKGPAFVRTKLRNLTNGKIIDNTFNSGVKIETVRIETRTYQFLYNDDMGYHFMNTENFEQVTLNEHMINAPHLLKPEVKAIIIFHAEEEAPLSCELESFVQYEVTYTEPGIKGDTATNSSKPAKIDCDYEIRVPLFINIGDVVKVDTRKGGEYVERVKQ
jgi:elongation factor P